MKSSGAMALAVIFLLVFAIAVILGWLKIDWNAITGFFTGIVKGGT